MKITISQNHRSKIQALRDELAPALKKLQQTHSELNRAETLSRTLAAEIAALEKGADPEDKDAVRALGEKRIELQFADRKLSTLSGITPDSGIMQALREVASTATEALLPTLNDYASEIAKLIRPFCPDDKWATHLAGQTPAAMSLAATISRRFGNTGFTFQMAKDALSRCDECLAGELSWTFDSNSGK